MRSFASDNVSGIHPSIFNALNEANRDHAGAYGNDLWTEQATNLFKDHFGSDIELALMLTGTGANVLAIALANRPYHAVICAKDAHIAVDECGSAERFTGCKLIEIDCQTTQGKLSPELIEEQLVHINNPHRVQPKLISITQSTELGAVYFGDEVRQICELAHSQGLLVHMDGARFSNACAALNLTLREASGDLGIDMLSFGGTKNGLMCGESLIVFNRSLFGEVHFLRKQLGQLCSKMRFLSAQFISLFEGDLWLKNAKHANRMAALLAMRIQELAIPLNRRVQANAVFPLLPPAVIEALSETQLFYVWNEVIGEVRLMTSFDTTESDIEQFIADLRTALHR